MRPRKEKLNRLEKALVRAWAGSGNISGSDTWKTDLMEDIRSDNVIINRRGDFEAQGTLVWRFSMVAAALTAFFAIYALTTDILPYKDLALMFLDNPAGFILSSPFV